MSKREAENDECSFFLARKKRQCRMRKANGLNFCPHHSHLGTDLDPKKGARIPCPLDTSHFCYESKLQKHLKKCNARQKATPVFYNENINIDTQITDENSKLNLQGISDDELLSLIDKIRMLHNELQLEISEITSLHPLLRSEMENSEDQLNTFKHMKQQAALLCVLDENKFLEEGKCFIEFGAGKGQLMYWIIRCVPESEKKTFILVDKSAQRHKIDNKFKDTDLQIQRLRIDIQHLFLGKIEAIQDKLEKVVGVSKHLCGGATDLALRCLTNTLVLEENSMKAEHKAFGLLMALCCHHQCSWNSYVGKEFIKSNGLTEKDFKLMCCIASWATCGRRQKCKDEVKEKNDCEMHVQPQEITDDSLLNRYQKLDLKHEEREVIGIQCKRVMDAGRIQFLRDKGYDVSLISYTEKSVSLENVALFARCRKS